MQQNIIVNIGKTPANMHTFLELSISSGRFNGLSSFTTPGKWFDSMEKTKLDRARLE